MLCQASELNGFYGTTLGNGKMETTLGTVGLRILVDGRRVNFYGLFHFAVNTWNM
jgi:hypothetical protein